MTLPMQVREFHFFKASSRHFVFFPRDTTYLDVSLAAFEAGRKLEKKQIDLDEIKAKSDVLFELVGIGLFKPDPAKPIENASPAPVTAIQLHVSHHCNLACSYCYANQGNYGGPDENMSWETAKRAVDFLLENSGSAKTVRISFFGGEPLLNLPVIKKVVPYAKQASSNAGKEVTFSMTTNGMGLTRSVRAYLKKAGIRFMISLDGTKDAHDAHRPTKSGRGSYDQIVGNLKAFAEEYGEGPSVRATHWNSSGPITDVFATLNKLPINNGFVSHMGNPGSVYFDQRISVHELELQSELAYFVETGEVRFSPFKKVVEQLDERSMIRRPCGGGRSFLAVVPDGGIYFCHRVALEESMKVGSVWEDFESIKSKSPLPVDLREPCNGCWARYVCGGQCYEECFTRTGDMHAPDPAYCRYMRSLLENSVAFHSGMASVGTENFSMPKPKQIACTVVS